MHLVHETIALFSLIVMAAATSRRRSASERGRGGFGVFRTFGTLGLEVLETRNLYIVSYKEKETAGR